VAAAPPPQNVAPRAPPPIFEPASRMRTRCGRRGFPGSEALASRGIRAQHGGSFLLARNLSALCDLTLKQARNARVHGGKVMSVTWISKSGVGSAMAAALVPI